MACIREFECGGKAAYIHQELVGHVGTVVWDAGIVLSKYLEESADFPVGRVRGLRVVELGAGTGFVGVVLAILGANVVITDLPELQQLMQKNIDINQPIMEGHVTAATLDWSNNTVGPDTFFDGQPPDLVIVADGTYYQSGASALQQTLCRLCDSSKTALLMSVELRPDKTEVLKSFLADMKKDFDIEFVPLERQHAEYQSDDIMIMRMVKRAPQA